MKSLFQAYIVLLCMYIHRKNLLDSKFKNVKLILFAELHPEICIIFVLSSYMYNVINCWMTVFPTRFCSFLLCTNLIYLSSHIFLSLFTQLTCSLPLNLLQYLGYYFSTYFAHLLATRVSDYPTILNS